MPNWSEEHFIVEGTEPQGKRVYKLKDTEGEEVLGRWQKFDLQPIDRNQLVVEKILRKRKAAVNQQAEALVKWKGWPPKFNSWIPESKLNGMNILEMACGLDAKSFANLRKRPRFKSCVMTPCHFIAEYNGKGAKRISSNTA